MRESSWREQEGQDRRIAGLEEDRARLAFAAQAAQAEAEAARREAAAQRRLAGRLQAAAEQQEAGGGGSALVVELLQKRCKVLEAQNSKLRLAAKASKEEEAAAAAAEAAAAAALRHSRQRGPGGGVSEPVPGSAAAEGSQAEGSAAENAHPNRAEELEGHPAFERWAADKRLQKKVEALQAKLRVRAGCVPFCRHLSVAAPKSALLIALCCRSAPRPWCLPRQRAPGRSSRCRRCRRRCSRARRARSS